MIYNNNVPNAKPHSSVIEIAPPLTETGYPLSENGAYGPEKPVWQFVVRDTMPAFSPFISGAHRMIWRNR